MDRTERDALDRPVEANPSCHLLLRFDVGRVVLDSSPEDFPFFTARTQEYARPVDEVFIRAASPADAPALSRLGTAVGAEPEGWLLATRGWRSAGDERRYLRGLRRSADAAVYVAEGPEGVVGRLSVARDAHPASRHVADIGLMVAAGRRRQGIGRGLLEAAVLWARSAGVRKLELHVFPHNEGAIRLYESFGFEREGLRRRHYRRSGAFVDVVLMAYWIE
jgi:putative acetyltransferase